MENRERRNDGGRDETERDGRTEGEGKMEQRTGGEE